MKAALKGLLEAMGSFSIVQTVTREATAALWLQENPEGWDVAIVDLLLDDGSGFTIVPWCKTVNPAGHVIVFSGYITDVMREKCLALGADAVFTKTSIKELVEHLEQTARLWNP